MAFCGDVRVQGGGGDAAQLPFGGWEVARALGAIPGAVGVSCQAALSTGFAINFTAVQGHLGDPDG